MSRAAAAAAAEAKSAVVVPAVHWCNRSLAYTRPAYDRLASRHNARAVTGRTPVTALRPRRPWEIDQ